MTSFFQDHYWTTQIMLTRRLCFTYLAVRSTSPLERALIAVQPSTADLTMRRGYAASPILRLASSVVWSQESQKSMVNGYNPRLTWSNIEPCD